LLLRRARFRDILTQVQRLSIYRPWKSPPSHSQRRSFNQPYISNSCLLCHNKPTTTDRDPISSHLIRHKRHTQMPIPRFKARMQASRHTSSNSALCHHLFRTVLPRSTRQATQALQACHVVCSPVSSQNVPGKYSFATLARCTSEHRVATI
jgi:hypothetical protein